MVGVKKRVAVLLVPFGIRQLEVFLADFGDALGPEHVGDVDAVLRRANDR